MFREHCRYTWMSLDANSFCVCGRLVEIWNFEFSLDSQIVLSWHYLQWMPGPNRQPSPSVFPPDHCEVIGGPAWGSSETLQRRHSINAKMNIHSGDSSKIKMNIHSGNLNLKITIDINVGAYVDLDLNLRNWMNFIVGTDFSERTKIRWSEMMLCCV